MSNLVIEAAYVCNRAAYVLANNTVNWNALSIGMPRAKGFDVNNAADRTILNTAWNAPAAQARGIRAPYVDIPLD